MSVGMNITLKVEEEKIDLITTIFKIENRKTNNSIDSFFKVSNKNKLAVFLRITESQKTCTKQSS